jgi:hypothetical protein
MVDRLALLVVALLGWTSRSQTTFATTAAAPEPTRERSSRMTQTVRADDCELANARTEARHKLVDALAQRCPGAYTMIAAGRCSPRSTPDVRRDCRGTSVLLWSCTATGACD